MTIFAFKQLNAQRQGDPYCSGNGWQSMHAKIARQRVVYLPRAVLEEEEIFTERLLAQGLETRAEVVLRFDRLVDTHWCVGMRGMLEADFSCLQIVPYVVCLADSAHYLFAQRKRKTTGEQRLAGKWTFGFGGHVEVSDIERAKRDGSSITRVTAEREVQEELRPDAGYTGIPYPTALLYRDSDDSIDSVHIGIIFCARIGRYTWNTDDFETVEEASFSDLTAKRTDLEGWSQVLLNGIKEGIFSLFPQ